MINPDKSKLETKNNYLPAYVRDMDVECKMVRTIVAAIR